MPLQPIRDYWLRPKRDADTSRNWDVKTKTTILGWGPWKWRSAQLYGPTWLGKDFKFFTRLVNLAHRAAVLNHIPRVSGQRHSHVMLGWYPCHYVNLETTSTYNPITDSLINEQDNKLETWAAVSKCSSTLAASTHSTSNVLCELFITVWPWLLTAFS